MFVLDLSHVSKKRKKKTRVYKREKFVSISVSGDDGSPLLACLHIMCVLLGYYTFFIPKNPSSIADGYIVANVTRHGYIVANVKLTSCVELCC